VTLHVEPATAGAARPVWRQVVRGWPRHVLHPVPRAAPAFAARPLRALLALLSIATPLALLAAILVAPFGDDVGLKSRLSFRFSVFEALMVLAVAPCVEEFLFRGPLGSRRAFERALVWLPLAAATAFVAFWLLRWVPAGAWPLRVAGLLVLLPVFAGAGLWLDDALERRRFTRVPAERTLFARHFPWLVHLSTLAFALSHSANYVVSWQALWFLPLAVLPQLVLGYACVYARATLGLRYAMLLHAGHNVIAYSLAGLAR
jgi:hypothetical protein